ncbi:hypothetical protein [Azotobacter chroococcum]|uniref:Uncharacterized protein n=1 Tax=Azotobacter chroococcum TaxID=353 RepID=A0AAP9YK69_9GAMM|nr:hypothetical protein [Azotobacter chroococcum]QQE91372.1 hypothetical protein GKQ51_23785 [Azotobacter chroococcum]
MNPLPLRAEAIGLVLFSFLPVALLLVGGFAVWEWWYLDRLPIEAAATHGLDERLTPGVLAVVVFALWMGGLLGLVGRALALRVIARYRWPFGASCALLLGILWVTCQTLAL